MKFVEHISPSQRQAAAGKLMAAGVSIHKAAGLEKIAQAVSRVVGTTCPKAIAEQQAMVLAYIARPWAPAEGRSVEWRPLDLSPAMRRAIHRAENPYESFVGDGRR